MLQSSTPFLHDSFLLCVQMPHYGQPHLAHNHVSISNTISTGPGSMLPSDVRGSGVIDAAFLLDKTDTCAMCTVVQNADARGQKCMKEVPTAASGRQRRQRGGLL